MSFNMKNMGMEKFMARMFKRAEGVVWDLSTGKIGVVTENGIATLNGTGEDVFVDVNMMDQFSMEVPAYAQGTPIADVKIGDLIYFGTKDTPGWVVGKKEKEVDGGTKVTSFKLMKTNGQVVNWNPPRVQMLGMGDNNVMVLRSLTNMLPGGQSGLTGMQNGLMQMLQMQMLMGGDTGTLDMDKIMPMMLMSQMDGGMGGGNMMQTMMFMQMMGGMQGLGSKTKSSPFVRG